MFASMTSNTLCFDAHERRPLVPQLMSLKIPTHQRANSRENKRRLLSNTELPSARQQSANFMHYVAYVLLFSLFFWVWPCFFPSCWCGSHRPISQVSLFSRNNTLSAPRVFQKQVRFIELFLEYKCSNFLKHKKNIRDKNIKISSVSVVLK
jgi:hypothetical protein